MCKRLKAWILRRLGYSQHLLLAEQIDKALRSEALDTWAHGRRVVDITIYISDFGDFRFGVKREPDPEQYQYIGE